MTKLSTTQKSIIPLIALMLVIAAEAILVRNQKKEEEKEVSYENTSREGASINPDNPAYVMQTDPWADLRSQSLLPFFFPGVLGGNTYDPIEANSVLLLQLNRPLRERETENPFGEIIDNPMFAGTGSIGLLELKESIVRAGQDANIKGIFLSLASVNAGFASLEELRNSLIDFKKSGKFLIAYGEYLSEGAYYLASVADEIFLNPVGSLELNGLTAEKMFYKGTLDKLGIKAEVFRVGSYKSAVEPLLRVNMSDENREQTASYLNHIYEHYLSQTAQARNLEVKELRDLSKQYLVQTPEDALEYNLITRIAYYDQVLAYLKDKLELKDEENLELVHRKRYQELNKRGKSKDGNRIAVIVASGEIMSGEGDNNNIIGADRLIRVLRQVRADTDVKAIVLRINSPGGSALASDVIWREIQLTKKVKPVVASLSDVAASGGYYLAMACNEIIAQPNTLTGSIGIFGVLLNTEEFFKDKLGITTDRVSTGSFSDIGSPNRPLAPEEREMIQEAVEKGYRTFTRKAAAGRKLSVEDIKAVAEGRVWSGLEALENNLVDDLGGLGLALERAAKLAKIDKYERFYLPEKDNFLKKIFQGLEMQGPLSNAPSEINEFLSYGFWLYRLEKHDFLQARLPYEISIK